MEEVALPGLEDCWIRRPTECLRVSPLTPIVNFLHILIVDELSMTLEYIGKTGSIRPVDL